MHVMHVPVRCDDTKFIEPDPLMLLQDLADNLSPYLRPRRLQDFLERRGIAVLHRLAGTVLIQAALEIATGVTSIYDRTKCWRGQDGKQQGDQTFFHVEVSA